MSEETKSYGQYAAAAARVAGHGDAERLQELAGRIRQCAQLVGSIEQLSQLSGVPRTTLETYLYGNAEPKTRRLVAIADAADVDVTWLATGRGQPSKKSGGMVRDMPDNAGEYAYIPLYNVAAAAGTGAIVQSEEVTDSLAFKRDWLRQEIGASPADLYLIHIEGESMEPTLRPGDVILVDHRDQSAGRDGIYVIRMDDALLVKRLQRLPGGRIRATSDNPAYEPFEIDQTSLKINGTAIIGRIVWAGRRM